MPQENFGKSSDLEAEKIKNAKKIIRGVFESYENSLPSVDITGEVAQMKQKFKEALRVLGIDKIIEG